MKTIITLLLAAVLASSCGGDSNPTAPTPQPFTQTVTGTVSVFGTTRHSLSIPRSGNLTLRLTWQDATVDLDLYLTAATCMELYAADCTVLLASDSSVGTSETITRTVTGGEQFQIWVDSLSEDRAQNYALSITVN